MNDTVDTTTEEPITISGDEILVKSEEDQAPPPAVKQETQVAAVQEAGGAITPMTMLQIAVEQGADIEKMEKLMDLQERWEANEAKKAFNLAMAKFKANAPQIVKDANVTYSTDRGVTTYDHAKLATAIAAAAPVMSENGLSHRWRTNQLDQGIIEVTCIITHALGHSEETTLKSLPDSSGGKNAIQSVGSTVSYLERYTFFAALGLSAKDMDDDGRASGNANQQTQVQPITEQQAADLSALLEEKDISVNRLNEYYGIQRLEDLPSDKYDEAVSLAEVAKPDGQ